MRSTTVKLTSALLSVFALGLATHSASAQIINGGFESGYTGWTTGVQPNSNGDIQIQSGTTSPFGFPVPAPPEGTFASMTDQFGPGSYVLYQDFFVPAGVTTAQLQFDYFIGNRDGDFMTPPTLDFNVFPNQQARVDIITTTADPFSVAAGDVLLNVYQTQPGDARISGYNTIISDLTALLSASGGQTLRLRFAEVDNSGNFQNGVDNVSLTIRAGAPVPEPGTIALLVSGSIGGMTLMLRRRRA